MSRFTYKPKHRCFFPQGKEQMFFMDTMGYSEQAAYCKQICDQDIECAIFSLQNNTCSLKHYDYCNTFTCHRKADENTWIKNVNVNNYCRTTNTFIPTWL